MASDKEVDKYRQFLEEIEHITKLTVGLTIRLSRLTKKIESNRAQLSEEMVNRLHLIFMIFVFHLFLILILATSLLCILAFPRTQKTKTVSGTNRGS